MSLHQALAATTSSSTHASRPNNLMAWSKVRDILFYRVGGGDVIEIVRLLHDAMEVQLHLPND